MTVSSRKVATVGAGRRGSGRGLGLAGLLAVGPVVLALELLDAARGVDVLHLAGEERMAGEQISTVMAFLVLRV